jgi:hypothetical protein
MNPQISQINADSDSRDPQTRAIIVELKATQGLTGNDEAQALNYLKATKLKRGCSSTSAVRALNSNALSSLPNLRESAQSVDENWFEQASVWSEGWL